MILIYHFQQLQETISDESHKTGLERNLIIWFESKFGVF